MRRSKSRRASSTRRNSRTRVAKRGPSSARPSTACAAASKKRSASSRSRFMSQPLPGGYGLQEYRIEKGLGTGGFGLTYLALDQNLNLKVALKEYLPGDIAQRAADQSISPASEATAETFGWGKRRFLDESRTLASFRHPHIVRVMRFFEANGSAYMVMEFVEGAPLSDWIKTRRPLPEAHLRAFVMPLLEGLEVVHKA